MAGDSMWVGSLPANITFWNSLKVNMNEMELPTLHGHWKHAMTSSRSNVQPMLKDCTIKEPYLHDNQLAPSYKAGFWPHLHFYTVGEVLICMAFKLQVAMQLSTSSSAWMILSYSASISIIISRSAKKYHDLHWHLTKLSENSWESCQALQCR